MDYTGQANLELVKLRSISFSYGVICISQHTNREWRTQLNCMHPLALILEHSPVGLRFSESQWVADATNKSTYPNVVGMHGMTIFACA